MDNRITLSKVNSESYNEFENESNLELIALERKGYGDEKIFSIIYGCLEK